MEQGNPVLATLLINYPHDTLLPIEKFEYLVCRLMPEWENEEESQRFTLTNERYFHNGSVPVRIEGLVFNITSQSLHFEAKVINQYNDCFSIKIEKSIASLEIGTTVEILRESEVSEEQSSNDRKIAIYVLSQLFKS